MLSEWLPTTLGRVLSFANGKTSPERDDGGRFTVFGSNGAIGRSVHHNAPANTIVIGRVGSYCGSVHYSPEPCWVTDNAIRAEALPGTHPYFAFSLLRMLDLNRWRAGSGQPLLNQTILSFIEVRMPPSEVQASVGRLLSQFDDRIDLLRQTNATLESIAQALFKSWFIDFEPVRAKQAGREPEGMDAATAALFPAEFEESALGLIPKGWQVSEVGQAAECVGGGTPSTKEAAYWEPPVHSWATPKDLSGLGSPVLWATERCLSDAGLKKVSSGMLPPGTLLMSSRAPIGYLAIPKIPVSVNQGFIAMRPGGLLPPVYLYFWCQANMDAIKQKANGSTFMEISKAAFRPIPLVLPPREVVASFTEIAGALFERISANEQQRAGMTDLRDTLLPRLISGTLQLPVKGEVFEVAAALEELS